MIDTGMHTKKSIWSGTSGLVLPVKNKEFYPEDFRDKSRLTFYGSLFNSIEINSSFYKMPLEKTVARWAEEVPAAFRFTFKLWKGITHNKGLVYAPEDVARFLRISGAAGNKLGCLLVQFPGSVQISLLPQLERLLETLRSDPHGHAIDIAVEFRHAGWNAKPTFRLLNRYRCGLVLHDKGASSPPLMTLEAPFVYLRFHGPGGDYRGSYEDGFLYEYARFAREWQTEGKHVYAYFNNTMGSAVQDLFTFNRYLTEG